MTRSVKHITAQTSKVVTCFESDAYGLNSNPAIEYIARCPIRSQDSSVAIVTRLRAGHPWNRGLIPGKGNIISPKRPHWL